MRKDEQTFGSAVSDLKKTVKKQMLFSTLQSLTALDSFTMHSIHVFKNLWNTKNTVCVNELSAIFINNCLGYFLFYSLSFGYSKRECTQISRVKPTLNRLKEDISLSIVLGDGEESTYEKEIIFHDRK